MKALCIESSSSIISFTAAVCDNHRESTVSLQLDTGMHHAEQLIPSIETVLDRLSILPHELDFIALSQGPGSFTGLRLSFSAAKGLSLSRGVSAPIPIYAIPTLDIFAYPHTTVSSTIISVLDAKKNRFYVSIYRSGILSTGPLDISCTQMPSYVDMEEIVLVTGPDRFLFSEELAAYCPALKIRTAQLEVTPSESLFALARKSFECNEAPIQSYDGPLYIRKSEAETNK